MKAKYALIALLAITFWGCDDNTAGLGLGMFPGSDQNINGKLSTFDVTTESVHAGKIYAMTNVGYLYINHTKHISLYLSNVSHTGYKGSHPKDKLWSTSYIPHSHP